MTAASSAGAPFTSRKGQYGHITRAKVSRAWKWSRNAWNLALDPLPRTIDDVLAFFAFAGSERRKKGHFWVVYFRNAISLSSMTFLSD